MNLLLIGYRGTGKSAVARPSGLGFGMGLGRCRRRIGIAGRPLDLPPSSPTRAKRRFAIWRAPCLPICVRRSDGDRLGRRRCPSRRESKAAAHRQARSCGSLPTRTRSIGGLAEDPASIARRPPLTTAGGLDEIRHLLAVRTPLYQECANWLLTQWTRTPAEVAAEILRRLPKA